MQLRLCLASRLAVWPLRLPWRLLKSANLQESLQPNLHRGEIHFRFVNAFSVSQGGSP
jgi:hypothetical protein